MNFTTSSLTKGVHARVPGSRHNSGKWKLARCFICKLPSDYVVLSLPGSCSAFGEAMPCNIRTQNPQQEMQRVPFIGRTIDYTAKRCFYIRQTTFDDA